MKTELCEVLGIEYPIIQGAMAHITDGKFAAAVMRAVWVLLLLRYMMHNG